MNINAILLKEQIIKSVREFFSNRKFHEVMTPVLHKTVPLERNIYPFSTIWHTGKGDRIYYLPTSPESYLKKIIAEGLGNCFSISPTFRNLEDESPIHRPEFLMLEWYRENSTYEKIMEDTKELIKFILKKVDYRGKSIKQDSEWPKLSMIELFQKYAGLDLEKIISDKEMIKAAAAKNYNIKSANWEQLFNQIFLNEIESRLGSDPFFILDFPSRISPLCAKRPDKPDFAERFEFYLDRMEIGNGNTENTDAEEVKKTFLAERKQREKSKMP
ncbi:hypothetical protein MUP32_04485, partial [Candidatus Microgenomates bacterium]|nr:hypothetical protein [Candidatus Microgenomates bacterium]